jgi:hypothetical protein
MVERGEPLGGGTIRDMHDQRIEGGPALGREDRGHGAVVAGVGAEPVDGLGREGDERARVQERHGRAQAAVAVRQRDGVDGGHVTWRPACSPARLALASRPAAVPD